MEFFYIKLNNFVQSGRFALATFAEDHCSLLLLRSVDLWNMECNVFLLQMSFAPDKCFIKIFDNLIIVLDHRKIGSWNLLVVKFTYNFCSEFFEYLQSSLIELGLISKSQSIALRFTLNGILHIFSSEVNKAGRNRNFLSYIHHIRDKKLHHFYCKKRFCINQLGGKCAIDCTVVLSRSGHCKFSLLTSQKVIFLFLGIFLSDLI